MLISSLHQPNLAPTQHSIHLTSLQFLYSFYIPPIKFSLISLILSFNSSTSSWSLIFSSLIFFVSGISRVKSLSYFNPSTFPSSPYSTYSSNPAPSTSSAIRPYTLLNPSVDPLFLSTSPLSYQLLGSKFNIFPLSTSAS